MTETKTPRAMPDPNWAPPHGVTPDLLGQARLELHWAAQIPAIGAGKALLESRADDSHTTLRWSAEHDQWVTEPLPGTGSRVAGLEPRGLRLTFGPADEPAAEALSLEGRTLAEGVRWLRERLPPSGSADDSGAGKAATVPLDLHYELPGHSVGSGGTFGAAPASHREELAAYFSEAHHALGHVRSRHEGASLVRTWPHHFDMATLIVHAESTDGSLLTIGVGLSPGDGAYDQPYFYVGPYPHPEAESLPSLPVGHWHTDGFFAGVLTASELAASGGPSGERLDDFLRSAILGAGQLLDGL